jgi:hypothetical protein
MKMRDLDKNFEETIGVPFSDLLKGAALTGAFMVILLLASLFN